MIGCPRTGPQHPIDGWCPSCPRVIIHRRIKAYEKRRGYVYPGCPANSTACRIWLDGLGNVYESDAGAAFVIDGCRHAAFVGAL